MTLVKHLVYIVSCWSGCKLLIIRTDHTMRQLSNYDYLLHHQSIDFLEKNDIVLCFATKTG